MMIDFDFKHIQHVEFGFSKKNKDAFDYCLVPVDDAVHSYLAEMIQTTLKRIENSDCTEYQPSEKYASGECCKMKTDDDLAVEIMQLYNAPALDFCSSFISDIADVYSYFTRMVDQDDQTILAMRRASQFKAISKSWLVGWIDDTLKTVSGKTFKLDNDFDLLADKQTLYIIRPGAFVALSRQKQAVLDAVTQNITKLKSDAGFLKCDNIQKYASKHPRAASYLASICSSRLAQNICVKSLAHLCDRTQVQHSIDSNGDLIISDNHILGFLEVLDRRRYELELVPDEPECYVAPSRQRLKNNR